MAETLPTVIDLLSFEQEWTHRNAETLTSVLSDVGITLDFDDTEGSLHITIPIAYSAPDLDAASIWADRRNSLLLFGRCVVEDRGRMLALVARLPAGTTPSLVVDIVRVLSSAADNLLFKSGPQRDLEALPAVALTPDGRRRNSCHPAVEFLAERIYPSGELLDPTREVLALAQDGLLHATGGWYAEHELDESVAEGPGGERLVVRGARHPHAGWGLMISVSSPRWVLNTDPLRAAGQRNLRWQRDASWADLASYSVNVDIVEHRLFLPNYLLASQNLLEASALALAVIRDLCSAAVAEDHLLRDVASLDPPTQGLEQIATAGRRTLWNDGLREPDTSDPDDRLAIWMDYQGRGCGIRPESYRRWYAQLTQQDREDPSLQGLFRWAASSPALSEAVSGLLAANDPQGDGRES